MQLANCIKESFFSSIELKKIAVDVLAKPILDAGKMLANCLKGGNKILCCGNGGSACDAQHFTAELVNRFLMERDGLPAIALTADTAVVTAIANDYGYQEVFAKQIKALGKKDDVLIAISTSGKSVNILCAINEAHSRAMPVIALTGNNLPDVLKQGDIKISVPSKITPRIQEVHILILHCLCELLERQLFHSGLEKS